MRTVRTAPRGDGAAETGTVSEARTLTCCRPKLFSSFPSPGFFSTVLKKSFFSAFPHNCLPPNEIFIPQITTVHVCSYVLRPSGGVEHWKAEISFTSYELTYAPLREAPPPLRKHALTTLGFLKIIFLYFLLQFLFVFMFRNLLYLEFIFVKHKFKYFVQQRVDTH